MKSHVLNLIIYSTLVSFFFAVLYNDTRETVVKHFLKWLAIFMVSALALGTFMYFFPTDPYFG